MKKTLMAVIAAGGIAIAGTGLAMAGEQGQAPGSGAGTKAQAGQLSDPQVKNAAQAADLVLREAGGGRVTGVELDEEDGRAVWRVTFVSGAGQQAAQVDASTSEVKSITAGSSGTGIPATAFDDETCDDDDDDGADDDDDDDDDGADDDDDDDDDDGGNRQGVEGNK